MTFEVRICNLGKLADATVRVAPLTVLAGVNNTGKSFFSKFLYSLLSGMNEMGGNPAARYVASRMAPALAGLDALKRSGYDNQQAAELTAHVRKLEKMSESIQIGNEPIESAHPEFVRLAEETLAAFGKIRKDMDALAGSANPIFGQAEFAVIDNNLNALPRIIGSSPVRLASNGVCEAVTQNLLGNFQASNLAELQRKPGKGISGEVSGFGAFVIHDLATFRKKIQHPWDPSPLIGESNFDSLFPEFWNSEFAGGLLSLRGFSRVIYLDSPAFWRVRAGLRSMRRRSMRRAGFHGREWRDGVPGYFHDLEDLLDGGELTGDVAFPEVAARIGEVIGGKVVRDDFGGHLYFCEGDRRHPLWSSSTGVANLGFLAMLIEKKLVDRGVFLFIDEPESNLHPAWQAEMTEALWGLARGGVNVVLATHSADMMERLRALVARHPEAEKMVALNHFAPDGVNKGGDKSFREKMGDILEELTEEFAESYMGAASAEGGR